MNLRELYGQGAVLAGETRRAAADVYSGAQHFYGGGAGLVENLAAGVVMASGLLFLAGLWRNR